MKTTVLTILAIVLFFSYCLSQTPISGGNVSGTWTLAGSPYLIQGAIMIPNDSTLRDCNKIYRTFVKKTNEREVIRKIPKIISTIE